MSRVVPAVRQQSEKPNLVLDFLRQLLQPSFAFIYMDELFHCPGALDYQLEGFNSGRCPS